MPSPATPFQQSIASLLHLEIEGDTERVAAARIREYIAEAILERERIEPATDRQIDYGHVLELNLEDDTKAVASAKIEDRLNILNQQAIDKLALKQGDRVIHTTVFRSDEGEHTYDREEIVSSIGNNLLVYFKGGNGKCGWPTQIKLIEEC